MKALRVINFISKLSGYIGGAAIVVLLVLMVADVLMRRLFASPITGATEMAQLTMVFIFLGVALTTLENRHVKVDTLMEYFPAKVQAVLDIAIYVIKFVFSLWLGWQAYQTAILSNKMNQIYSMLKIPIYPFYWVVAASFFLVGLSVLGLMINKAKEVARK